MSEIDTSKREWDFSRILPGELDSQIDNEKKILRDKIEEFSSKWRKDKSYLTDSKILKRALDDYELLLREYGVMGNVGYFLILKFSQNQLDEKIKNRLSTFEEFEKELSNSLEFFTLNISKVDKTKQEVFLNSPELVDYRHFLEKIFKKAKHKLSEELEKVMTLKSGPAYESWVNLVEKILSSEEKEVEWYGEKELKNFSEILAGVSEKDKKTRDSSSKALNEIFLKNLDIATAEINAILSDKKINDSLRRFSRADESRILSDDVDFEFVDGLREAINKNLEISKGYYELKTKLFGCEKLEYHERNVPYGELKDEISYEKAVKIVYESFKRFDGNFAEIFKNFVENGDIDVYPSKGKVGGAFCTWGLKKHPVKILLNHTNKFSDVKTMAHETGHGINHELIKKQNSLNFGVPMATAEVTSNFAEELFLNKYMEEVKGDEEKLVILMSRLNSDISSSFRQIACYDFEMELHKAYREKGYLSKGEIGKIFRNNMEKYMGGYVEQSNGSENWWVYWSHIRNYFYVYSYASGILIAKAMYKKFMEDKNFAGKIKEFFSLGKIVSPRSAFKKMGFELDSTFWGEGLKQIENDLNEARNLARKLNKI